MRIFIHTRTKLPLTPDVLLVTIKALVIEYTKHEACQISIVGSHIPETLVHFCALHKQVTCITPKEAIHLYKLTNEAKILHFGINIKAAGNIPVFFIPLDLPNGGRKISILPSLINTWQCKQWVKNAKQVLCINDWVYTKLKTLYPAASSQFRTIHLPHLPLPGFEWKELQETKETLTKGVPYFLCFAPQTRFVAILKEFSIFKKWQQTTMNLVFVFDNERDISAATAQLKGYKFKDAVILLHTANFKHAWLAAAYVILWEGISFSKCFWAIAAIEFEVPLLFDTGIDLPSSWSKAGEVFSFTEKLALSNHFKLYYKDELYRQASANKGKIWLTQLNEKALARERAGILDN